MNEPQVSGLLVRWPVLLRHPAEPELAVISDQAEWSLDPDLHAWPHHPESRLIDSDGWEYMLVFAGTPGRGDTTLSPTGHRWTLEAVVGLAEAHLRAVGAPPEWLSSHLAELPSAVRIRATILYLSRLDSDQAAHSTEEES